MNVFVRRWTLEKTIEKKSIKNYCVKDIFVFIIMVYYFNYRSYVLEIHYDKHLHVSNIFSS